MQAAQLPEPAAVPVQRPASPALAPALRTISGETPHYRARFEVAAADGADAAEAVKEIVMGWLHAKGLDVPEGAATALYGLLFEDDGCEGQVAGEFQRRTGYELTFSESSATRARPDLMKMRERSYGGRTVDISAHIKGRSQKNSFRLHFYIDRENELIVIGYAGCHMKTAGSHRRGFK